jgi:hypothetical protein
MLDLTEQFGPLDVYFDFTSKIQQMSQSEEDIDQQVVDWSLEEQRNEDGFSDDGAAADGKEAAVDGDGKDVVPAADGGKQKEVIDVDVEEGIPKKEMNARSKIWDHFIKIKEKGVVVKGKCKYCNAEIKAHLVLNGTSGMRKHFGICKCNPHRCSDDATQVILLSS